MGALDIDIDIIIINNINNLLTRQTDQLHLNAHRLALAVLNAYVVCDYQ